MNAQTKINTLELIMKLDKFTALNVCHLYQDKYNTKLYWHEFSDYLTELHDKGVLSVIGHDVTGLVIYSATK